MQINDDERTNTVKIMDTWGKTPYDAIESYGEKLITRDVRGNLLKAKRILKKALHAVASARACISKWDKSCLCDKNYVK